MKFLKTIEGIKCDKCNREIAEWEYFVHDSRNINFHVCKDCAFKDGKIDECTFLKWHGAKGELSTRASIKDGEIVIWRGARNQLPPWERKGKKGD